MLLRTVYSVSAASPGLDQLALPLELSLAEGINASLDRHVEGLRLSVHRSVDPSRLEVVRNSGWFRELPSGAREALPCLRLVDDEPPEHILVEDFASAVTFLTDMPLVLSRPIHEDRFVPENDDEQKLLARLGTDEPYHETGVRALSRTFSAEVDADGVSALLTRPAGVRLYADAVHLTLDVARFRELWRVLESAFAKSDDDLVQLLAAYPPARQLGFDVKELADLRVLRGRASHAQSKAGVSELIAVEQECGRRVVRLKNLVERVILTKKSWGYPTVGVEELAPLAAYVGPAGEQVMRRGTADA
jgi:hypothetical protein